MSGSEKVQAYIQGIGLLAVVVSLVFVGLQLKQSQEIAIAGQIKVGLDDPRTWIRSVYEDNPMIWRKSFRELVEELIAEQGT